MSSSRINVPEQLAAESYLDIERLMLGQAETTFRSFAGQMALRYKNRPAEDHPNAYLFTMLSAIPLADAVRGFCGALSLSKPIIGTVNTKLVGPPFMAAEIDRVHGLLDKSTQRVTVVDEYVHTGGTLERARTIASQAGAKRVTAIGGMWYKNALVADINITGVTSVHALFMNNIGRAAARMMTE